MTRDFADEKTHLAVGQTASTQLRWDKRGEEPVLFQPREIPLMSPSLLSQRLKELEDGGVVVRHSTSSDRGAEYHLTQAGKELGPIIMSLGHWGARWTEANLQPEDYDPALLMWDMRRRIDLELLPKQGRTVVAFDLEGSPRQLRRWWLVVEDGDVDICLKDPGYPVSIDVSGDIRALVDVWQGRLPMDQAVRQGCRLKGRNH